MAKLWDINLIPFLWDLRLKERRLFAVFETLFERHRELQMRRADEGFDGFTLIELLIVIVVLGILAATVIFALGGVTGQSAQAACNSDAKTTEVAVQAYIASPDNPSNTPPTTMANLYSAPFGNATTAHDTFETAQNNKAFTISLGGTTAGDGKGDNVFVGGVTNPGQYDNPAAPTVNPCDGAS